MKKNVYLDYNATSPLRPEVKAAVAAHLDDFGNPSSLHQAGRRSKVLVDGARVELAALLGCREDEFVFTSGGTESNNAVLQLADPRSRFGADIPAERNGLVVSSIEHPAVFEKAQALAKCGVQVTVVPVSPDGIVDPAQLKKAVNKKTALVSIMAANNETGTLQDIPALAEIAHSSGALFHTDAVQLLGKQSFAVEDLGVDYLSCSGHKIGALKGVGGLYIRHGAPFQPFLAGGHQENGRRAGTSNTLGISSFGKAAEAVRRELPREPARLAALRQKLSDGIRTRIMGTVVNGDQVRCLPNTLNVSFPGAEGESLLLYLDFEGICVSTGSACASGSLEPSPVLLALGRDEGAAHSSLRFSLGFGTTESDIDAVLKHLPDVVARVRSMSTVWQEGRERS